MKDRLIWRYVQSQPWAIVPDKLDVILDVLLARIQGHGLTDAEIESLVSAEQAGQAAKLEAAATIARQSAGLVAVLPLLGTIFHRSAESLAQSSGGTSVVRFRASLNEALANKDVRTILIDTDSPGGTVTGVPELAEEIYAARDAKRIVALSDSLMASAAYWLASQAHELVSIPSGMVGSIGVMAAHEDVSERAKQLGIKVTLVSAGKYKTEGNPFEPLSDEAKTRLQGLVDDAYDQFVKAVARGRGVRPSDVRAGFGQGRVLTAPEAREAGLIDRIATRDDTIARLLGPGPRPAPAASLAGSDTDRRRRLVL